MADDAIRLDLFLWFVRIVKTRQCARLLATEGRIRIDGHPVSRSAAPVRTGSVLTFALGDTVRAVRVEALPRRRGPASEAALCITDLIPGVDAAPPAT